MNSRENDLETPCHITFKRFYIKKVTINRRPQLLQQTIKERPKIAFGCNIKCALKDRSEQPSLFYDKKYTCIDKHHGVPLIQSARNSRTKSEYDGNEKNKKTYKFDEFQNSKSLSLSFQPQKYGQKKKVPIHSDPLNYLNKFLPMTSRQLKESFIMLLKKHQSGHINLEQK
ncbi:unnamed protein product (macronuclear) [Paramecium tetraurelia]|uniref:Uncharacterized protein n=1 Tax=Paramecium tetraurelia TaxID=5888 RepID=A0BAY2_PARTE|nr:uncharacterized protein GSPATT00000134001 [Paramecium tetraurelia]CAK55699.1 unnamed protein product [Paramecium tetraurelia]|eukprot:XP_001423097.1 hypothetical protein (macronuclear) [Paramecium tetraurelia strain d4-2]